MYVYCDSFTLNMHFHPQCFSVDWYCMLCLFFSSEEPLVIVKPLQEVTVIENQPSVLTCELSKPDVEVQWTREGEPITTADNVKLTCAGVVHSLIIEKTTLDDEAVYALTVGELSTEAEILVDGESMVHGVIYNHMSCLDTCTLL